MKRALGDAFPDASFTQLSRGLREVSDRHGEHGRSHCFDVMRTFESHSIGGLRPVQQVLDLIEQYRGKVLFAICSNNMHATIHEAVRAMALDGVFRVLVGRDDVSESKPAPEGLLRILATLQVTADEALFVGNHADDERAGAAAGIRTVVISPC
jgi:beta-phosphoglucomutase-like phosphatase (HAD superfamily)